VGEYYLPYQITKLFTYRTYIDFAKITMLWSYIEFCSIKKVRNISWCVYSFWGILFLFLAQSNCFCFHVFGVHKPAGKICCRARRFELHLRPQIILRQLAWDGIVSDGMVWEWRWKRSWEEGGVWQGMQI